MADPLGFASFATREWFRGVFAEATAAQAQAWPVIAKGEHCLVLAPTGSGKTLSAFLHAIDHCLFHVPPEAPASVQVLYVSPLKALAFDVERNLKAPLAGISARARSRGQPFRAVSVGLRTGDTSSRERARMLKAPPDVLITTPESLYLMLTSRARHGLAGVHAVIIDEIHSLCGNKRGAHLALSLERLEALRRQAGREQPAQRIGLSATQRPLDEVARFLGGVDTTHATPRERPVTVVDAGRKRELALSVEVPVDDLAEPGSSAEENSIWPSMHPRLVELIRAHRSTMIFVNSRRLAERLAGALNELADEELCLAHHGSIAREQRTVIEDRLKMGQLPAIVATSSLELGIDMGAVDLVVQIEAPPTVASGIQRVGRAGHQVGGTSKGVVFPKYRGDLLTCAAAVPLMEQGQVEKTRYLRNPLDVLAQHVVAVCVTGPIERKRLLEMVRGAAGFADLAEPVFDGVLDMLSGRYPSERFRDLAARINWDRSRDVLEARRGARMLAVGNAGTITERGLYGVFLAGSEPRTRVGELDEEMVFETNPGDVFLLGASSWRVEEITHDQVLVSPASGQPGKMPFWRGDGPARPLEFGQQIGAMMRTLLADGREAALQRLHEEHRLDERAANNAWTYLEQQASSSIVPTDRRLVLESFKDEIGDWRVVVLSPLGGAVHAPWATVISARLQSERGIEVDSMWSDDGMVFRLPDSDEPPELQWFLIDPGLVRQLVAAHVSKSALFAAHFRENAARALLLPRRRPGQRLPLWVQRRKSSDLLHVASGFPDFPILLETFRECLQDVFDLDGLEQVLTDIESGGISVVRAETASASPFAAALMFSYVGDFIYNTDAPLAERKAQALSLDQDQLRLLLGEPELREMLSPEAIETVERSLLRLDPERPLRDADDLVDLLRALGDLSDAELAERPVIEHLSPLGALGQLEESMRAVRLQVGGEPRWVAIENAARYRDALGAVLPLGVPSAFLVAAERPLAEIVISYARCHGPFTSDSLVRRYGIGRALVKEELGRLREEGLLVEGAFLPTGQGLEYCHVQSLRRIKQLSLAKLRRQIEPIEQDAYARFLLEHQAVSAPLLGLDGLLTVIQQLQGISLPLSSWIEEVLPARVQGFSPRDLDELCAAGEVVWRAAGATPDPRVAFYLTDDLSLLALPPAPTPGELPQRLRNALARGRACFFSELVDACEAASPDVQRALWEMVLSGEVTNDTLLPLRSQVVSMRSSAAAPRGRRSRPARSFRSRRRQQPGLEGRWSLLALPAEKPTAQCIKARAEQLVARYGVVTREAVRAAGEPGGFAAVYPAYKLLEEAGRLRRGYFIAGFGATQFCLPGAESQLRSHRHAPRDDAQLVVLASQDPANPYGAALPWPTSPSRLARAERSWVVLGAGRLLGYLSGGGKQLTILAEASEADVDALFELLLERFLKSSDKAWFLASLDGQEPGHSRWAAQLQDWGFAPSPRGWLMRRSTAAQRLSSAAPRTSSAAQRSRAAEKSSHAPQREDTAAARDGSEPGVPNSGVSNSARRGRA